jgi:hypothetical protein
MAASNSFLYRNYFFTSIAYGVVRKIPMLYDAKIDTYNFKPRMRSMLFSEKVMILASTASISPIIAPIWFYSDLGDLEIKMKKQDRSEYGYHEPSDIVSYIFF